MDRSGINNRPRHLNLSKLDQTMDVGALMSVEESEQIAPLLGEDTYVGINWEGRDAYCNIYATKINEDIINTKPINRTCEIESELASCTEAPKKKARVFTTVSYS
jgi:hypothetical protein